MAYIHQMFRIPRKTVPNLSTAAKFAARSGRIVHPQAIGRAIVAKKQHKARYAICKPIM